MRYSLISRELVNDSTETHLEANRMAGVIAVVACDKPPVGTVAALLAHNAPAIVFSDGSIRPGIDPATGDRIDLVAVFQYAADPDDELRARVAVHACPGQGSCGGMFTYNTMQTFIGVLGLEPLHMISPSPTTSDASPGSPTSSPTCSSRPPSWGSVPRSRHPAALRNALTVVMAMGDRPTWSCTALRSPGPRGMTCGTRS